MKLLAGVELEARLFESERHALELQRGRLHAAIRAAASEGIPAAKIGRAANLSRERVRQIVAGDA